MSLQDDLKKAIEARDRSLTRAEQSVQACEERIHLNFREMSALHALALYTKIYGNEFPADINKIMSEFDKNRYQEAADHAALREARERLFSLRREHRDGLVAVVANTDLRATARLEAAMRLLETLGLLEGA